MNTDEMIAVMQAYARGEAIEFCDLDRPDIWFDVTDTPQWAWDLNSYRVKPKYGKFKIGDKILYKDEEVWPLITDRNYTYGTSANDFLNDDKFIKFDDVLWYWEFKMSDGWHISQTRMTSAQAQAFVGESVDIAPLYALGFRIKDEK